MKTLKSTEETVEEARHTRTQNKSILIAKKKKEESIALASEKAKRKAKRAKTKKTRDAGKPLRWSLP